jgi:hypothetical protein
MMNTEQWQIHTGEVSHAKASPQRIAKRSPAQIVTPSVSGGVAGSSLREAFI